MRTVTPLRLFSRVAAAYAVVSVALWPVPVFGLLHAESAAVVSGVGCVLASVTGIRALPPLGLQRVVAVHLAALVVPLVLLSASMLWRPNCGWLQGLGLFLLMAPPSVLFGVGVAAAVEGLGLRAPRATAALVVLASALGGVLLDLGLHPQLFTYSHVFGGVLGPIYDQELAVRPGLIAAKGQTLLWAAGLVLLGGWARARGRRRAVSLVAVALAVAGSYLLGPHLGIVQTEAGIQRVLADAVDLGPVVLHVHPEMAVAERRRWAEEALFRLDAIAEALDAAPARPVQIYVYPDPDTKGALIGSRETSVVPVWLRTPQVHLLADALPSLGHELVHVVAREFGAPILRASPAVGLVEGLAVALEPPSGLPSVTALVRAGAELGEEGGGLPDPAAVVAATMSPGGFWTARGGVAYTANGAFARWLLDTHGPEPMKAAYRSGRFEAFGAPLPVLARQWGQALGADPVDPEAVAVARWLFSRPSLFEVRCPHHVPASVRLARDAVEAWEAGRAGRARALFDAAAANDPLQLGALDGQVAATLAIEGRLPADALAQAQTLADSLPSAGPLRHLADVRRLLGRPAEATYRAAADSLAPVDALGRLLLGRRRILPRLALARWLSAPPDSVSVQSRAEAPVLAALRLRAERPDEAWAVARTWCVADLSASLADSAEGARVLRLLQAQTATAVGALDTADALLDGLDEAFDAGGPRAYAAVVRDLRARVAWRRSTLSQPERPSIFDTFPTTPDALDPRCPGPRPDRGVRRAR